MGNKKKTFILSTSLKEMVDKLDNERAGILFKAVFEYETTKEVPEEINKDFVLEVIFAPIQKMLDDNYAEYQTVCERNKSNAFKRWGKNIPNDTSGTNRMPVDATRTSGTNSYQSQPVDTTRTSRNQSLPFVPVATSRCQSMPKMPDIDIDTDTDIDIDILSATTVSDNIYAHAVESTPVSAPAGDNYVNDTISEPVTQDYVDPVYAYYEKNIDLLTERTQEVIEPYRETMPDDLVIFAMQLAVDNKARRLSYVEGVLKSWQKSGIKTLLQAKEEHEKFRDKKAQSNKANAPPKYRDTTGQYSELEDFYEK